MTWGTEFKTDVILSHQTFLNKFDVEDKIHEIENKIIECESKLKMFASANPIDIIPTDYKDEPISWLHEEIQNELDLYHEYSIDLFKLNLYLEYLNYRDEMNTGVNIDIKNLLRFMHIMLNEKIEQFRNDEISSKKYADECDILMNEVIGEIKTKLSDE